MRNEALRSICAGFLAAGCLGVAFAVDGNEWPQFRGTNRDDKSPKTGLLKMWPEAGPRLVRPSRRQESNTRRSDLSILIRGKVIPFASETAQKSGYF
jgi:hypothetical protein